MALVTTEEAKAYLRVDSSDEDSLISSLITSAEFKCADVARLSDEDWNEVNTGSADDNRDLLRKRSLLRVAILYTVAYMFEHREEAKENDLDLTLRSLLYSIREGVF